MVKSLLQKQNLAPNPEQVKQLVNLEREIDYLETTLFELESKTRNNDPRQRPQLSDSKIRPADR